MKKKLILLQPEQYNELFSTYHHSKRNLNPNSRLNLPKILTNLPKDYETQVSTSRTNNSTSNNKFHNRNNSSFKKKSYIFDRHQDIYYPIVPQQKGSETTRLPDFLPFPSVTQRFRKITDNKSKEKKKFDKNDAELKMVYLNLLNIENNKNDYKIESFLTERNEKEKVKNDIINTKIDELNKKNLQKLNNMFSQTDAFKIKNDLTMINNMPIVLINLFAEEIYKNFYMNNNETTSKINNKNINKKNINQSFSNNIKKNAYINNTFFKYVLDNVKHKIEVINESNHQISVLYVKNLISDELKYLQKQLIDYKKQYYTENTSNNISKISNYEITSRNTFHFKTNNSSTKDNENIYNSNNNSSVLGSLIKKNIYAKRNEGKKRQFDIMNMFHIDPNYFFQNKAIISLINKKEEDKNAKKIKIVINSYKSKKKEENDEKMEANYNLTSNSVDHAYQRMKSKKTLNKEIERTFSQVFLKSDYAKASDCIKEISNIIEKKYINQKKNNIIKKNKIHYDERKNNKEIRYKYENNNYNENSESHTITPKRTKKTTGTNTDFRETKIKFKNEKMKNNYEKVIKTIKNIKQKKKNYYTPNKSDLKLIINNNEDNKQNQKLYNNNKLIQIYINNNKNNNINISNKIKNQIDKATPKNSINPRNKKKNKDLNSIKTSKPSTKKNKDIVKNNFINNNDDAIYQKNENTIKNINKNNKKQKDSQIAKLNIIDKIKNNNNINVNNQNEIINKMSIKVEDSEEEEYTDEESEEEEDEDEEEDTEEKEEEGEDENEDDETKQMKKILKKIRKEKKKLTKIKNKQSKKLLNKFKTKYDIINEIGKENVNDNDTNVKNGTVKKNFQKIHSVIILPPINTISIKSGNKTPRKSIIKSYTIRNKTEEKSKINKYSESLKVDPSPRKKKYTEIRKQLFNNDIDESEEENDRHKYNINRDELYKGTLTKNKKTKKYGGIAGKTNEKFIKGKNNEDSFLVLEEDDEVLSKSIKKKERKKNNALEREEEIEILKEVEEMDEALTLEEKKIIVSEMLQLRDLIIQSFIKDKEIKEIINSKRYTIYKIVNRFFTNWIKKDLSMKIIDTEKYRNKLQKLVRIQSYSIFLERNLKILEKKYIIPYLEKEKKRKEQEEERRAKLRRKKLALEEFERYKRLIEEKKRKGLIYDNSYLFKNSKKKQFKLRKEVEEILNTDYGKYYQKKHVKFEYKEKKIPKKKKGKKTSVSRKSFLEKKELTKEERDEEEERIRLFKEMEERQRREEIFDKRLRDFFNRIHKLKNGEFKDFDEELNFLMEEQIDQAERAKENIENRMNSFMKDFQFNRVKAKYNMDFKNKQFEYISPIIFTSEK